MFIHNSPSYKRLIYIKSHLYVLCFLFVCIQLHISYYMPVITPVCLKYKNPQLTQSRYFSVLYIRAYNFISVLSYNRLRVRILCICPNLVLFFGICRCTHAAPQGWNPLFGGFPASVPVSFINPPGVTGRGGCGRLWSGRMEPIRHPRDPLPAPGNPRALPSPSDPPPTHALNKSLPLPTPFFCFNYYYFHPTPPPMSDFFIRRFFNLLRDLFRSEPQKSCY